MRLEAHHILGTTIERRSPSLYFRYPTCPGFENSTIYSWADREIVSSRQLVLVSFFVKLIRRTSLPSNLIIKDKLNKVHTLSFPPYGLIMRLILAFYLIIIINTSLSHASVAVYRCIVSQADCLAIEEVYCFDTRQ